MKKNELNGYSVELGSNQALNLDCGVELNHFIMAFQTYGRLNKNKTNAINNFLDYLSDSVDWPKNFSDFEKKKKWFSYKSKRQVNLGEVQLVDNGKIGSNYFVVMGIKKEALLKNEVTFDKLEEIINK